MSSVLVSRAQTLLSPRALSLAVYISAAWDAYTAPIESRVWLRKTSNSVHSQLQHTRGYS